MSYDLHDPLDAKRYYVDCTLVSLDEIIEFLQTPGKSKKLRTGATNLLRRYIEELEDDCVAAEAIANER